QDSINPCTHPNIMMLDETVDSGDAVIHPFCYAHVLGIFHADIFYLTPGGSFGEGEYQPMNFLWIQWFSYDSDHSAGFSSQCLHHLSFLHDLPTEEFGFLDPDQVVQSVHLIPTFSYGHGDHLGKTLAHEPTGELTDWNYYYINM
ncbi:hypothetical protein P691DRAFT_682982, partial [Macrolepiota fuliginosa MF-IS2]